MKDITFVHHHLVDSLRAAIAEANGCDDEASRLRSQAKLRLMSMSERDIWELAGATATYPDRPVEQIYSEIQEAITLHRDTAHEWLPDISGVAYLPVHNDLPDTTVAVEEMDENDQISMYPDS
ncbi:MAG: hypothetical protein HOC20_04425 [Chloroflexi bacterium]|nr:hypothetical protein [Chloroflexota bacterium]